MIYVGNGGVEPSAVAVLEPVARCHHRAVYLALALRAEGIATVLSMAMAEPAWWLALPTDALHVYFADIDGDDDPDPLGGITD